MKSIHTLIAACSLCFFCVACEDDLRDQTKEPDIHAVISHLHKELNGKNDCESINKGIDNFKTGYATGTETTPSALSNACSAYMTSRSSAGTVDNLATRLTSSGYYMTSFILVDRYKKQAHTCKVSGTVTASEVGKKYDDLFLNGCEQFFQDASEITEKYSPSMVD